MSAGTQRLAAAFVEQTVARAVAAELGRSLIDRRDLLISQASAARIEVERLRRVVAEQAARIADLQARLDQAQAEVHRLTVRQLVDAVTRAVLADAELPPGYAISDARVQVRAAVKFTDGHVLITADPGGLLDPESLSTLEIRLASLPPPLGKAAASTPAGRG